MTKTSMTIKLPTFLLLITIALSLGACSNVSTPWYLKPHKTELPLSGSIIRKEKELPPFTGVAAHGPFDIDVLFLPQQYYMTYSGNSGLVDQVTMYVEDGILHLFTNQEFEYSPDYRITVNLEVPCLTKFSYRGPGKVQMANIESDRLVLNVEESGYVYMTGKVTRLDATLSGTSRLNAKCLYVRTAFVNTVDLAQAEVATNGSVSALSADNSDIYYYENTEFVAPYENASGSIMRMEGIAEARPAGPIIPMMKPATAVMMPEYLSKNEYQSTASYEK